MAEPSTNTPADKKGRRRWVTVVLVISLGLNLMVAGAVAAHKFFGYRHGPHGGLGIAGVLPKGFFFDLSRERRKELMGIFETRRQAFRDNRPVADKSKRDIAAALETDPLDEAKLAAAVAGFADFGRGMINMGQPVLLEFYKTLNVEERRMLAERIRKRIERKRRWGRW